MTSMEAMVFKVQTSRIGSSYSGFRSVDAKESVTGHHPNRPYRFVVDIAQNIDLMVEDGSGLFSGETKRRNTGLRALDLLFRLVVIVDHALTVESYLHQTN